MLLLCQLLHFQNEPFQAISDLGGISALRKLALTCDKYDCVNAVSHATSTWIESLEAQASEEELITLAESAYVLDHAVIFESVTKRLVLNDTGQILERIIEWTTDEILPVKVYGVALFKPLHCFLT